jgi:putative peptidoglycan lipid II flippase
MLPDTDITLQEPQESLVPPVGIPERKASAGGRIARAALVLIAGTVLSRLLGLGREVVIADLFGGGADVDAFTIANHVATIVYDLLIAGTVSAALVPVFSEYTDSKQRPEFGRVISTVLTVAAIFLVMAVLLLEAFAQPLSAFMGAGFGEQARSLALEMTQWVLPGVFFMGLSGVVMAAHYALGRFVYPAFSSAMFNAAIIFCAFTLAGALGVKSLVVGMVIGAFAMLALQVPGLRDVPLRPRLDLRHPAVRKIFRLYAPVGLSVVISSAALVIDRNLVSQTGEGSISAMRFATTLIQFAMGFVAAAISLAALPSLSQHFSRGDSAAYKKTLASGLRMVWVMALPAAAGLLTLAGPIVELVFRHGEFTQANQSLTVLALLFYVPGLPFGAIDQVLIFAFYARKNTLTPVLVGIAAIIAYLITAFSTIGTMGMAGLVLANSVQLTFHAVVTGGLLWRALGREGGLGGYGIGETALKVLGAAAAMAVVSYGAWWSLVNLLNLQANNIFTEVIILGIPALLGGSLYVALIWLMRLPEVELITGKIRGRLKRTTDDRR